MGNDQSSQNSDYVKQFSAFVQRVKPSQVFEAEAWFDEFAAGEEELNHTQQNDFFNALIDRVAPSYSEEKRKLLMENWRTPSTGGLHRTVVLAEVDKNFVREFSFHAEPLYSYAPCGIKYKMPALIQIETPVDGSQVKPPIAMVCVLDRSGSMSGNKIAFAKRAICKVVKHLTPSDHFSLVTYSSEARVCISNGDLNDKDALMEKIKSITADGLTNISDAMRLGADLLDDNKLGGEYLKRIFLFSDGEANRGNFQSANDLGRQAKEFYESKRISCSTFGLGKDYKEDVMSSISRNARGDYYFIESASSIPETMSKAIHALLSLYGTNASLRLTGCNDGVISQLFGRYAEHSLSQPLPLGDLCSNDRRRILMELELSRKNDGSPDEEQIVAEAELVFTSSGGSARVEKCAVRVTFSSHSTTLDSAEMNKQVYLAQVSKQVSSIDRQIVQLLDKNDRAGAIAKKEESIALLEQASRHDREGLLVSMTDRARRTLEVLRKQESLAVSRKEVDYDAYCEEMDCGYAYVCQSDSDEEYDEMMADDTVQSPGLDWDSDLSYDSE